jgi:hypothetical protein
MISAKKSNGVKNITNNMYTKQIIFIEIDKNTNSKEKKMVVSYSYNILYYYIFMIDQPFLFCRHLIFDNG